MAVLRVVGDAHCKKRELHSPVPSSKNPYFQNEAKCTTFLLKISFISMRMKNDFRTKGWALKFVLIQRSGGGGGGTRKWPFVSGYWKNSRLPSTRTSRSSKQRRFWATHVDQKWTYSFLICLVASKFVLLRVFSLIETICPKICLKSSLKSTKSPLSVDAHPSKWSLLFRHHQSTIVVLKKMVNTVQCTIHGEP